VLDFGENCRLNQTIGGNHRLDQRGEFMPITDFIGKVLYPRQQRWERRRKVRLLFIAVILPLIVIAACALIMLLKGSLQFKADVPLQSVSP
jgi:hypothetical protein